jgi:hypothetical protein
MTSQQKEAVEQVRLMLFRCIERFFQETAPRDEHVRVDIEPAGEDAYQKEEAARTERGATTSLRFHLPDGTKRDGTFAINHAGGNVYEVRVRIADGDEQAFQLSVPEPAAWGPDDMQTSATGVCRHILAELERTRGKQHLEEATAHHGEDAA